MFAKLYETFDKTRFHAIVFFKYQPKDVQNRYFFLRSNRTFVYYYDHIQSYSIRLATLDFGAQTCCKRGRVSNSGNRYRITVRAQDLPLHAIEL